MLNLRDFWSCGGIYFKTFGPSVEMEAQTGLGTEEIAVSLC